MWLRSEGLRLVGLFRGLRRREEEETLRGRQCDLVVEEGCVWCRGECTTAHGYTHKHTLRITLTDTQTYALC